MFRAIIVAAIMCAYTQYATAACNKPAPPAIPDPASAVTAQMVKAQKDVKSYIADAEKFLKCVRRNSEHDKMVDEMKSIAATFNETVRAYKERMDNA